MLRRGLGWAAVAAIVALVAFAPFRDGGGDGDVVGGGPLGVPAAAGSTPAPVATRGGDAAGGAGSSAAATGSGGGRTAGTPTPAAAPGADGDTPAAPSSPGPGAPDVPEPDEATLAVLGPLVAAMDAGQTAGTPLLLGIATAVVATGLPADDGVPPEARPVVQALAQLIATPGTQVNQVTAQNSLALAQLDRALGELAFANPALNESIHQTAAVLATLGRSARPVTPPGGVLLEDLSILLGFFVVE